MTSEKKLAEDHWLFIEKLLATIETKHPTYHTTETLKYLYMQAIIHGYKHGISEAE